MRGNNSIHGLVIVCALLLSGCSDTDIEDTFDSYLWRKRVLLVFSPTIDNELLDRQTAMIRQNQDGMIDRDMVIWQVIDANFVAVDDKVMPHLPTARIYRKFAVNENVFSVILLGKDGEEKLRTTDKTVSDSTLFSLIDAMPMRQREMQEKEGGYPEKP